MCPIDSAKFSHEDLYKIGQCVMDAFDEGVDASIMWTFRNELEPRWSYLEAWNAGWIRRDRNTEKSAVEPVVEQN